VTNYCVTFPHERQQRGELGTVHVAARGFIEKATVQLDSFKLPSFILIEAAYAQVADPLTLRAFPRTPAQSSGKITSAAKGLCDAALGL